MVQNIIEFKGLQSQEACKSICYEILRDAESARKL